MLKVDLKTNRNNEDFLQLTLDSLMSQIAILDETGKIISVNKAWKKFAQENGVNPETTSEGVNYLVVCDTASGDDSEEAMVTAAGIRSIINGELDSFSVEYPCHSPDKKRWFIAHISHFTFNDAIRVVVNHENITDRKIMEESLQESEEKFRYIFEKSVIGKSLTKPNGELGVNQAFADLLGYSIEELQNKNWNEITHPDDIDISKDIVSSLLSGAKNKGHFVKRYFHKNGSIVWTEIYTSLRRDQDGNPLYFISTVNDITAAKHLQEELIHAKRFLENVLQTTPSAIFTVDLEQNITSWNQSAERITGYTAEEVIGKKCSVIGSPTCKKGCRLFDDQYPKPGEFRECELFTKDGRRIFTLKNFDLLYNGNGEVIGGIESFIDITRRKHSEQKNLLQSSALESAANGIVITNRDGVIEWVNPAWCAMTGYSVQETIGKNPRIVKSGAQNSHYYKNLWETILSGHTWRGELVNKRKDGSLYTEEESITPFKAENGDITHFVAIKQDITQRKKSEYKIQNQLSQLAALREIDQTIISELSRHQSLNVILTKTINLLEVDAAVVLLLNEEMNSLVYAAGLGFWTDVVTTANVDISGNFSGKAAKEKRIIKIPDVSTDPTNLLLTDYLKDEKFISYFSAPLIVKGNIIGVLELFHRSVVERDAEWLEFFETLAGQAAIAIDNAQMFNQLKKKNEELINAYDATIKGWSYALDLRDKETEGHSTRVTYLAVKMAKLLGINNGELEQIYRGAILHDIGKMGVPDYILHKPDKLTEQEFEIIKKHPEFSYQMISSISFLKPALDIPYCHHENWDGSGYPRGLKGEEIPLSARMFAIIDVYDALTSDRPYRKAWIKLAALDYIQEQSGIKFDPQLIPHFMEMINEE